MKSVKLSKQAKAELISKLDKYQKRAFDLMVKGDNVFISGEAGSGKSLLLTVFAACNDKKVLKVAPTGVAALNINGVTIHSAFGYGNLLESTHNDLINNGIVLSYAKKQLLKKVSTIVVDEASMLRSDVFEKMDLILRIVNKIDKPFGGKQIILIGDIFQLPPVVKQEELDFIKNAYGGVFFYDAKIYKEAKFKFIELKDNHRQQKDSTFRDVLNHIRVGNVTKSDIDTLNSRLVKNEEKIKDILRLFATRREVEEFNTNQLSLINSQEFINSAEILFNKYENSKVNFESNFMCPEVLRLKEGAVVMFVQNDERRRWVNGTIGTVVGFLDRYIKVKVKDKTYNVEPVEFTVKEAQMIGDEVIYTDTIAILQYPLMLAYAITIHKSQGLTYDEVSVDLSKCFMEGQGYVALSRATSLEGLHLCKPIESKHLRSSKDNNKFYTTLKN